MKNSIKLTLSLIFTLIFFGAAQAQDSEWVRLQSDNGEFSIELPKNPTYFYDKDGFYYPKSSFGDDYLQFSEMQMLNASDGKTVLSLEVYNVVLPEKGIDILLERQNSKAKKLENLPKNFRGKQFEKSSVKDFINQKDVEISFVSRYIASKTHLYIVTAASRGAKTPAFEKLLSSIRLSENQTGNAKISSLKALTLGDVAFYAADQPKPAKALPKPDDAEEKKPNPTPILVLTKPQSGYSEKARRNQVEGVIRFRVTFEKDGRVSKIGLVSTLQNGLDRSAFFAALRIKFIPAEKDGVPKTFIKPVEYSFKVG